MELFNSKLFSKKQLKEFNTFYVLLIYIIVSFIVTYPIIFNFKSHIIGIAPGGQLWNFWWFKRAIFEAHKFPMPYIHHTDLIYYPYGQSLYILDPLNALLSIPFQAISDLATSYNIIIIFNVVLAQFSMYLLARYLTSSKVAGFISGIIYGCSPYMLGSINNSWSEVVNIGWIPLSVLYLYKLLRENKKRNIIIASLFFFLVTFSCWYYGMYICIFLGLFILFYSFSFAKKDPTMITKIRLIFNKKFVSRLTLVMLLFILMIYPFAHYFQKSMASSETLEFRGDRSSFRNELFEAGKVDLAYYFHPGKFYPPDFKETRGPSEDFITVVYVGYLVLLLAFLGSLMKTKEKRFWLFSLFLFFILSLGPYLYMNGRFIIVLGRRIPLPYFFMYKYAPFFYQMKTAHRFNIMVMLSLSVLAGYGFCRIYSELKDKNKLRIVVLIVSAIIFEFLFLSPAKYPIPSYPSSIPSWYYGLAKESDNFGIIDLPVGNFMSLRKYLYFQTVHHKKIPYSFYLFEMKKLFKNNPFLFYLRDLFWNAKREVSFLEPPYISDFRQALKELESLKFKYIVVHNNFIDNKDIYEKTHQFLRNFLDASRDYEGNITVYKIY